MSLSNSSANLSPKRSFRPHLLLYAAAIVPILTSTIFRSEVFPIAGAIASVAMLTAWAFMTGVRKFFCALLLLVVAFLCVAEGVVVLRHW